jgi:hypothetical protein
MESMDTTVYSAFQIMLNGARRVPSRAWWANGAWWVPSGSPVGSQRGCVGSRLGLVMKFEVLCTRLCAMFWFAVGDWWVPR